MSRFLTEEGKCLLGLYIHIPFCPYRCHYCDFLSFTGHEEAIPAYVDALKKDLTRFSEELRDYKVVSIFFGGGTPSLLSPSYVGEILEKAHHSFDFARDVEITLESNPGTLTLEKLKGYRACGVNRLSLGVQALQDRHLERMGRIHSAAQAREAFELARGAGFQNLNVDLIFGLPDQSESEWKETLRGVLSWQPEHLSAYGLQIEEGTPFGADFKGGRLALPGEEKEARMFEAAFLAASERGLQRYEISNFAKPGKECVHNLIYWNNKEYLGIGVGAVSYVNGRRFWMTRNVARYLSGDERVIGREMLPREGEMGETMMLGLRLREGISAADFQKRFGTSLMEHYGRIISRFEESGFMKWENARLALTQKGILVANEIVAEFLPVVKS